MPIRQGGMLASRASTCPRDHFCRNTMAPRASWPTTWNEFLPISMPITAIAVLGVRDMACSLSLAPLASFACWRGRSTAGPSHYRTFRLAASVGSKWSMVAPRVVLDAAVKRIREPNCEPVGSPVDPLRGVKLDRASQGEVVEDERQASPDEINWQALQRREDHS